MFAALFGKSTERVSKMKIRLTIYGIILFQIFQSAFQPLSDFVRSYWLINYDEGFVRRGLAGELARLARDWLGLTWDQTVALCGWAVGLTSLICILLLIEALLQKSDPRANFMAFILAASPFLIDQILLYRRPDTIGMSLLIITGFASLLRSRYRSTPIAFLGVLFGISCFIHEAIFFLYGLPSILLLILTSTRRLVRSSIAEVAILALPSIMAVVAIAIASPLNLLSIQSLKESAPLDLNLALFDYLNDRFWDSRILTGMPMQLRVALLLSLLVGIPLLYIHITLVHRTVQVKFISGVKRTGPKRLTLVAGAAVAVGILLTFLGGTDWLRWICIFGGAYVVVAAFQTLASEAKTGVCEITKKQLTIIAMLGLLPPLPYLATANGLMRTANPF